MPTQDIDDLLLRLITGVNLFRHLERDNIVALLRHARKASFPGGEVVFNEGADHMPKGAVGVSRRVSS